LYVRRRLRRILVIFTLLFTRLPIDTLRRFHISLFLGINLIISGFNNIVKGTALPQFHQFITFHILVVISPDGDRDCRPKHVAHMRNK